MASLCIGAPPPMASSFAAPATSLSFSKSQSLVYTPPSLSASTGLLRLPSLPFIYCGRGDKKTARGKRFKHSFGNARPKDKSKGRGPPRVPAPPLPPRKDKYDDGTVVRIEIDESLLN